MSTSTKKLKVVKKFSAPATFYRPSGSKGKGWVKSSGQGGTVIISRHYQEDKVVANVIRFQNYLKKDALNCRILEGLPLNRGTKRKEFRFKSSSCTSSGTHVKTVFALKFHSIDDADDFEMWWLALNGSIRAWLIAEDEKKKENSKPLRELTNSKRKVISAPSEWSPFEPDKKRSKLKETGDNVRVRVVSTNSVSKESVKDNDSDDEEDVIIDEYAPSSQRWMTAFE